MLARFLPRFIATARGRLERGLSLVSGKEDEAASKLKAELHSLAGEASMLGLAEIGEEAREAEDAAGVWATKDDRRAMVSCARALRSLTRKVEALDRPAEAPDGAASDQSEGRDARRVLIIDDSVINAALLEDALEDRGVESRSADTLEGVLEALASFGPSLILSDVNMPGLDCVELCQQIRRSESGASAQLLLVSGMEEGELEVLAERAGADGFISKHAGLDDILEQAMAALERGERTG